MIEVIFEDNHLLVLNKPAGLLTQPSGTDDESLESLAKAWIKKKYEKPGNVFLGAIHRLDRGASGIVVFAKTSKALSRLMAEIRNRHVKKVYHALVEKTPVATEALLEHELIHDDYRASVVDKHTKGAKHAVLYYRVLKTSSEGALLEIKLETGRYHQIRAQLAAIGSPVKGDKKYGAKTSWKHPGIALHHCYFEIPHPITHEIISFNAKEPW